MLIYSVCQYILMVVRLCISISELDKDFLDVMQLSPSGLLKQRIEQIRKDSSNYQNMLEIREKAIINLQSKVNEYSQLLTKNGIIH